MALPRVARLIEHGVGFVGGEPLIPEMNRKAGQRAELGGEGLDLFCARAETSRQVQRQADDDAGDAVAPAEARNGAQGLALCRSRLAMQVKGEDGLSGKAELVRDGNADASRADIEGQIAGRGGWTQWSAPVTSLSPLDFVEWGIRTDTIEKLQNSLGLAQHPTKQRNNETEWAPGNGAERAGRGFGQP